MAEMFLPSYAPRRTQPQASPEDASGQVRAESAGDIAGMALRVGSSATQLSGQGFDMAGQQLEILSRERKVLEETRAAHWLEDAKQRARDEIDLYLTSPDSDSHTRPERIPERVGEILQKHASKLGENLSEYGDLVKENAAWEYRNFGAQTMPAMRHEKTQRIQSEAIAGASEFVEMKKKEFFEAPTDIERQRITDAMLGRMEFLRDQGFITPEQEERFQIGLSKDLVQESITQRIQAITLNTPSDLVGPLYEDIAASSLMPSEKAQKIQEVNAHMSMLLNEDARAKNLANQERKAQEEEAVQGIYDTAFDKGDMQGSMAQLSDLRRRRVIDSGTYMQVRDKLSSIMAGMGESRRKHSDPQALIASTVAAQLAGSPNSALRTPADVMTWAVGLTQTHTGEDVKGQVNLAMGGLRRQEDDAQKDQKTALEEAYRRLDDWHRSGAMMVNGFAVQTGHNPDESAQVSNGRRRLQRMLRDNPHATPEDIEIETDKILIANNEIVKRLFRERNPKLYDQTIGQGMTTIPQLWDAYNAGRITRDQYNDLGNFVLFRDQTMRNLPPPGQGEGMSTVPPLPAQSKKPPPSPGGEGFLSQGGQWMIEQWKTLSGAEKQTVEKEASRKSVGGYLSRLKSHIWGEEQRGNKSTP